ncbi:MAG: hypothetical protein AAF542_23995 [Pseudomonadota bacterium]
MKFQTRSRESIQELQLKLLRKQIAHCKETVPYYRELLTELGFDAGKLRDLIQLERLPLLDKSKVRKNEEGFRSELIAKDKCYKSFSSGSTGEPFASYFDARSWFSKKYWVKLRARFACGMKLRQRIAIIECESEELVAKRNRKTGFADAFLQVRVFSLFKEKKELVAALREFAPQNIYAYPSHLLELADAHTDDVEIIPGLERLFTSSEFLERGMRQLIEKKFHAPVFDTYGSTEFKEVAWQCEEKNWYHINNDQLICEVVDADGSALINEAGHIVVTDLRNKAMPLLRFDLGDLGVLTNSPCNCGYHGNSIKPLGGRASDYLLFDGGIQLSPFRFTTQIEYLPGMLQYQINQTSISHIEISARLGSEATADTLETSSQIIRDAIAFASSSKLADSVQITTRIVDSIENEINGKFKIVKRSF